MQKLLYIFAGIAIGVASMVAVNAKAARQGDKPTYEYQRCVCNAEMLNARAAEGWRAISGYVPGGTYPEFLLERPKK